MASPLGKAFFLRLSAGVFEVQSWRDVFADLSLETSVALRIDEAIREQACRKRSVCSQCVRDQGLPAARKKLLVGLEIRWHDIVAYGRLDTG